MLTRNRDQDYLESLVAEVEAGIKGLRITAEGENSEEESAKEPAKATEDATKDTVEPTKEP
jgi:hypothetical protein